MRIHEARHVEQLRDAHRQRESGDHYECGQDDARPLRGLDDRRGHLHDATVGGPYRRPAKTKQGNGGPRDERRQSVEIRHSRAKPDEHRQEQHDHDTRRRNQA